MPEVLPNKDEVFEEVCEAIFQTEVISVSNATNSVIRFPDNLILEEPLEIRLGFWEEGRFVHRAVSVTMRTPGDDLALAAGFLFTEGIISNKDQLSSIKHCVRISDKIINASGQNTVRVDLRKGESFDFEMLKRNFYMTSSCGICGKSSLEALKVTGVKIQHKKDFPKVQAELVTKLPKLMRENQVFFNKTGGIHASALFDLEGKLLCLKEDVGRHNAVDKLIGEYFLKDQLPLNDKILVLSGRASFELMQKALMAGIPVVCAVGAPSSLAVEVAKEFDMTLLGFVREDKFNVYCGFERLEL
ncbi:MAG: formate dehydrogenase accessory sulfurtransferase FdhD [Acidobacteria bacterium]|nr:MAG: formate dehydrogenase accessory sulfurtransferase FdhD [Acidobacteriota bacterium]